VVIETIWMCEEGFPSPVQIFNTSSSLSFLLLHTHTQIISHSLTITHFSLFLFITITHTHTFSLYIFLFLSLTHTNSLSLSLKIVNDKFQSWLKNVSGSSLAVGGHFVTLSHCLSNQQTIFEHFQTSSFFINNNCNF